MDKILFTVLISAFSAVAICAAQSKELSVGLSTIKIDYAERSKSGVLLDDEKSDLLGKTGGIRFEYLGGISEDKSGTLSIGARYDVARGDSDYTGSLIGSGLGYGSYKSTTLNTIHDLSVWLDDTRRYGVVDFGLYAGLGYRYWVRELSSTQKEDYKWPYWKIGGHIDADMTQNLNIGLGAEYKSAFSPKMKAYGSASPVSATFNLGAVNGYSIFVPIKYKITKNIFSKLEYTYDYWKIGSSNEIGGFYEPDSKTKNQILTLSVGYKW